MNISETLISTSAAKNPKTKQETRKELLAGLILYTVLFLLGMTMTTIKAISETGSLLGGDGVAQYYPLLLDLRRNTIDFFRALSEGTPVLRMMNFNFMFGSDTVSYSSVFLPALPLYMISALVPESSVGLFFAVVVIILSYLAGISNIFMCRHFKAAAIPSGIFSLTYVFCGSYFYTILWNPMFLYMMIAFPLMIAGIDNILNDRSWLLFSFSVAYLALCGFTMLLYTLPFVIVFAAVRVYFLKSSGYLINLAKYFLKGFFFSVLGIIISAFSILPYLYFFLSSSRSSGGTPELSKMFIPSLDKITILLYPYDIGNPVGLCPVVIIFIVLSIISAKSQKEHKLYEFISLLLVSLPFVWYGINAFIYDLCRWGFVPACLFSFIAAFYAPELLKIKKRPAIMLIVYLALHLILFPFRLGFLWIALLIINAIATSNSACRKLIVRCYLKQKRFKEKNKKAYRYTMSGIIIIISMAVIFLSVIFIMSPDYSLSKGSAIAFILTIIICIPAFFKKRLNTPVINILATTLASFSILFPFSESESTLDSARTIEYNDFYKSLTAYSREENFFNRFSDINTEAESFIYNSDFETQESETNIYGYSLSDKAANSDPQIDLALRYGFASSEIFYSVIDNDYIKFLRHCGMDSSSLQTSVSTMGFNGKEAVYSLLGINYLYSDNDITHIYGMTPDSSKAYRNQEKYIYKNSFALPVGVTYDIFSSSQDFEAFNAAELPYAMMNSVYLEGCDNLIYNSDKTYSKKCSFRTERESRGTTKYGIECFNNTITLDEPVKNSFVYLVFSGVSYRTIPEWGTNNLTLNIDNKNEFIYQIANNESSWKWKLTKDLYALPVGMCRENINKISFVSFFEYDSLEIIAVPEETYTEGYKRICRETLENVRFHENTLTGNITVSSDKVLCINLIHNNGWRAYIDGKEAPVYKANGMFLGIKLDKGTHDVRLVYRTPMLYEGAMITLATLFIIIAYNILKRKKHTKTIKAKEVINNDKL